MKAKKYDAIIIGSGQAGKPLVHSLAAKGWKVAVIEKKYVGGSCINYGCTPTKAMVASAGVAYLAEQAFEFGVSAKKVTVNFPAVMKRKDGIVRKFRNNIEKGLLADKNIDLIYGTASFTNKKYVIEVDNGKRKKLISSRKIFINTGSSSFTPNIKGINDIDYLTSHSILELKKLPEHLIILGGSYIALEFGQMFSRFGSKVTLIERSPYIISKEDNDISEGVRKILEDEGIKIITNAEAGEIQRSGKKLKVILKNNKKEITGTHLLVATGIKPATSDLNLNIAGIKTNSKGFIKTNPNLETNVKGIFALGDVNGGPAFTHISYDDYRIVLSNLTTKKKRSKLDRLIPYTLFTDPPLGRVGLTEKEAKEKNLKYKSAILPMKHVARAIEAGETKGFMKALVDVKTKKILGCAVLGAEGGEIMAMIELAMIGRLTYDKVRDAIFSHPTLSESLNSLFARIDS